MTSVPATTGYIGDAQAGPDPRRWRALAVLTLVQFMLILDVTVVNVALPSIQADLRFSPSGLAWVVDGYVLTAGGLLLLGGRLADLLGRRRMFLLGVTIFAIASVTSGAAQSPAMLIASRLLQGTGEALASPAAFGLIALLFVDKTERAKALGVFGGIAGLGGALGPIISGLVVHLSWRWIFFINIPVAAIALIAVSRLVSESRAQRSRTAGRPDIPGAVLMTAGLSSIVFGLVRAAIDPWTSLIVLIALIGGAALLLAFVLVEATVRDPLVPLRFFANRTRLTANIVTLFYSSAFFVMFYLLTLYFEQVQRYSPIKTGLLYLPIGLGIIIGIGIATALIPTIGIKNLLAAGFAMAAIGMLLLSRIEASGSYWTQPFPGLVVMAIASGFVFSGLSNAAVHQVSAQDASLASGVQNATQQLGGAVGLAVLATIALQHTARLIHSGQANASATTSGYVLAFRIGAITLAIGALLVMSIMEKVQPVEDPQLTTH